MLTELSTGDWLDLSEVRSIRYFGPRSYSAESKPHVQIQTNTIDCAVIAYFETPEDARAWMAEIGQQVNEAKSRPARA